MILFAASLGVATLIAAPVALVVLAVRFAYSLWQGRRLDRSEATPDPRARTLDDLYDVHVCSPQTCGAVYNHEEDGL